MNGDAYNMEPMDSVMIVLPDTFYLTSNVLIVLYTMVKTVKLVLNYILVILVLKVMKLSMELVLKNLLMKTLMKETTKLTKIQLKTLLLMNGDV